METKGEQLSKKWKLLTSAVIWYGTFTLGLGVGFLGPSLIELSRKFETSIPTLSKVFTVITIAFLIGAITCGIIFNYVNRQCASSLLLILMGIGTILLPLVPSLPIFFAVAAIVGIGAAGYDTAQIVWIIEMWESKATTYIQVQHFAFAVGTFISPLLMNSFLPKTEHITTPSNATNVAAESNNGSDYADTIIIQHHNNSKQNLDTYKGSSQLYIPFLIGGLASIVAGILIVLIFFVKRYKKPVEPSDIVSAASNVDADGKWKSWNTKKLLLLTFSALFLGGYQGMEMCSMQFLAAFTQFIDLKLSQPDAALVLSGLTGAFTLGRAAGIVVVFMNVLPEYLLAGNVILIITGNTLLLFFANDSLTLLWLGAILLGIGFSTVFPSFYGFIEKHLRISNVVGAVMIVAGGIVSSLYPIIIGTYIEQNPLVLMYTNYFSLACCIMSFLAIYVVTQRSKSMQEHTYAVTEDNLKY